MALFNNTLQDGTQVKGGSVPTHQKFSTAPAKISNIRVGTQIVHATRIPGGWQIDGLITNDLRAELVRLIQSLGSRYR